jgi:uncharacterized short protein YbdD (DUF466 family)
VNNHGAIELINRVDKQSHKGYFGIADYVSYVEQFRDTAMNLRYNDVFSNYSENK